MSNFLVGESGEYFSRLSTPEFGGIGHTGPLGSGTYTIWFQETQSQREYTVTYTVVPEPATGALLAMAIALGTMRARRRS